MVQGVKVTPITRTNVKLTWDPLVVSDFNGDSATGGYVVEYRYALQIADSYFFLQSIVHKLITFFQFFLKMANCLSHPIPENCGSMPAKLQKFF